MTVEELLRGLAPEVLAALMRRYGEFGACEDAVQEAMLAAVTSWPDQGVPDNPQGWLLTVASRRLIDEVRSEHARRRREQEDATASAPLERPHDADSGRDDSLSLLFLCCHPALSGPSQIAITLRAVGGLSTAQIAVAFLVPEATMAQRISRAKQAIKTSGARFELPGPAEYAGRLGIVLHVLYLIFNEGYTATAGASLTAPELSGEAIRLTRWLHRLLPQDPEITGLLALMLLTDARRAARTGPDGSLIPLDQQDRTLWDRDRIGEAVTLLAAVLSGGRVGPYQVQAAIAAVHDEAESMDATDWPQILGLYELLEQLAPGPMVSLNRAVAVAMVAGPAAGLDLLDSLESDRRLAGHHRLHATRAHLLEMAGDRPGAVASYQEAARRTTSLPEQRYLTGRAAQLAGPEKLRGLCREPVAVSDPRSNGRTRRPGRRGLQMTKVVLGMTMSLDGMAAPETWDADGMELFGTIMSWVFPLRSWREQQGQEGGEDSVDSRVWADQFARFGPQIVGRTMFDYGYPSWGENPPFHAPVFVVTHRGGERIVKDGGTSYTFVTGGIGAAVEQARAVAGGQDILLAGGVSIARQALAAKLVDEVVLHVAPVLVGRGMPLFGGARAELRCVETIAGEGAVHLRYEVR